MKIINDKFNQLKEYAKVLQDTGKLKNRIKIVEIILCSALAVAVLRLFFMQCLPHAEYSAFYKEKFEDKYETDIDGAQYGGTISDINGAILVADNYSADIRISTAAMSSLSYRQRKNCKKEEKDEEISHKKIKLPFLEFKFAVPFVVSSYSPHCSSLENENFKKNSYFVEKFLQNNKDILQNRKKETSNAVYYKNLNISEFEKMQQQISGIRNVREMINGFKFYSPTGFFREICRTANNKTLSETQIGDLIIPEREKLPYNDENRKIYEKMTLNEYCMTAKFDSNIEMGLILSDIFEKNRFSPEILNSIEQSLSDEDKKKFSKKDMEILEDRNFSKKDYCKDSYDSVLCQKLYEYNLDQISSFFAENKSYFGNDYQNIISKIEKAKKSHPNKKENIKLPDSDKIDIKGTLASFAWRTSDFFDFIISVLKFKKEYERTIVIYTDNGGKFISVNKKKARQLSGKNKKLLRADAEMAKDRAFADFAEEVNSKFSFEKPLLNPDERNYIILTHISPETFYSLLPDTSYFGGIYSAAGIEFEEHKHDRDIIAGTSHYSKPFPAMKDVLPSDYVLAPLVYSGGIEKSRAKEMCLGSFLGECVKTEGKGIKNIRLTIDSRLQNLAELLLRRQGDSLGADRGFAIVQKVKTGELAAAAYYNPDWEKGDVTEMQYFAYQPGSIFKPFTAAIALESGLVKPEDRFNLVSLYEKTISTHKANAKGKEKALNTQIYKAWESINDDHGAHTRYHGLKPCVQGAKNCRGYSIKDIIAESSNIGTSWLAWQLWDKDIQFGDNNVKGHIYMKNMLNRFGFGEKTGFGKEINAAESSGRIYGNSADDYKPMPMDYLKNAYGQGPAEATPLQIVSAYSALLNGGNLYKPYIISSVEYREGTSYKAEPVLNKEKILSEKNLNLVKDYMKAVFEIYKSPDLGIMSGTGKSYAIPDFIMGGKTGTADKFDCPKGKICFPNQCDEKFKDNDPEEHKACRIAVASKKGKSCSSLKDRNDAAVCRAAYATNEKDKKVSSKPCAGLSGKDYDKCSKIVSLSAKLIDERKKILGKNGVTPNRASFVGFLPFDDPEYVILVMFDESEKAATEKREHRTGATAAGPVLRRIAEEIIKIEGYEKKGDI